MSSFLIQMTKTDPCVDQASDGYMIGRPDMSYLSKVEARLDLCKSENEDLGMSQAVVQRTKYTTTHA